MLNTTERMQKILAANQKTLARVDAILCGEDSTSGKTDPDCRTCTLTEAARRMGVSRPTVYRLIGRGALRTVELNGVSRVTMRSIFDYVQGVKA